MTFFDTHCHVAFMAHPEDCLRDARACGSTLASVSVTPQEFRAFQQQCASYQGNYCGLGLHPWWVPANDQNLINTLEQFDALLEKADFIGEVGLDYSTRWVKTRPWQIKALEHIIYRQHEHPLPMSLHCVRAYDDVLDRLQKASGLSIGPIIFHWFSGTSDQLQQAIKLGCFFSVSKRMLATKRGRAYVQAIPEHRLLLETDAPDVSWDFTTHIPQPPASTTPREKPFNKSQPEQLTFPRIPYSYAQLASALKETCALIARLRSLDPDVAEALLMANAQRVFSDGADAYQA